MLPSPSCEAKQERQKRFGIQHWNQRCISPQTHLFGNKWFAEHCSKLAPAARLSWVVFVFNSREELILHGRTEENVLFNDGLNTFYLRLYGVRHIVKDHSDSKRGNPMPPHWLLFPISSKCSFICTNPQQDSTYHGQCYTSRGALAGSRNRSMGPPCRIDPTIHRTMSERYYHRATSRSFILNAATGQNYAKYIKVTSTARLPWLL